MSELFDLSGKRALITGSTGGLGSAIARAFAAAGAELVLSDATDACVAQANAMAAGGVRAEARVADLGRPEEVKGLAAYALEGGGIGILVCNAGLPGPVGPLNEAPRDALESMFEVNLLSVMAITGAIIPGMARAGNGSVILMSSIAGLRGNRSIGAYGVSKAALAQLARNLAVEWGPHNVRVNSISPGLIRTPFAKGILEDPIYLERRLSLTPLRRAGEPEEIAGAALFLASRAGGFVTGHNLVVDGGTTITDGN
jgi:NAD(P)-dependent dehydrogenase (short-subunit alcohol dehydrogenase family)